MFEIMHVSSNMIGIMHVPSNMIGIMHVLSDMIGMMNVSSNMDWNHARVMSEHDRNDERVIKHD